MLSGGQSRANEFKMMRDLNGYRNDIHIFAGCEVCGRGEGTFGRQADVDSGGLRRFRSCSRNAGYAKFRQRLQRGNMRNRSPTALGFITDNANADLLSVLHGIHIPGTALVPPPSTTNCAPVEKLDSSLAR